MNVGYRSNQSHTPTAEGRKLAVSARRKPSAQFWFIVPVLFPLLPFLLEGLIRLISCRFKLYWNTFSGSTLAMSYGLLFIFINQRLLNQLLNQELPLMNEDKMEEIWAWYFKLHIGAIVCFVLFAVIAFSDSLIVFHNVPVAQELLEPLYAVTFGSSALVIPISMLVRSKYNLKTVL